MLTGAVELDQVRLLRRAELGRLAAQAALGLGDFHALAGAHPDQVRLELGDHRQHVEQQPPDRVGRVMHRTAEVQLDLAVCELVGDRSCVGQRAREPVELGNDERVARAACRERLMQARALAVGARKAVVDVDALGLNAERSEAGVDGRAARLTATD